MLVSLKDTLKTGFGWSDQVARKTRDEEEMIVTLVVQLESFVLLLRWLSRQHVAFSVNIVPNMKVRGQPACPGVRKKYKTKCWIVYICSLYTLYHAPMMFTCIKVLSRQGGKGGCTCEIWIVGTNNKLLGGPRQTRWTQVRNGLGKGSAWPEDEARMDVFVRCCKGRLLKYL